MADNVRIVFDKAGFDELRNSAEMVQALASAAEAIAWAAGDGYEASEVHHNKDRASVSVYTATPAAMIDNARNDTLMRSLDAGR